MGSSNPVSIDAKRFNVTSKWARARGEMVVGVPVDSLPAAVERASARLPKMKLTGVWPERAEFQRSGWNTYARMITVAFEPVTAGSTRVVVTSTPAVATTVLDFGKSRGDVVEALSAVSAEL